MECSCGSPFLPRSSICYNFCIGSRDKRQDSVMPNQEDIANQQELLATYRRRLARHLKQLAQLGETHAPPDIFESIREARVNIQRIKGVLRVWGVPFEDHPDDE